MTSVLVAKMEQMKDLAAETGSVHLTTGDVLITCSVYELNMFVMALIAGQLYRWMVCI